VSFRGIHNRAVNCISIDQPAHFSAFEQEDPGEADTYDTTFDSCVIVNGTGNFVDVNNRGGDVTVINCDFELGPAASRSRLFEVDEGYLRIIDTNMRIKGALTTRMINPGAGTTEIELRGGRIVFEGTTPARLIDNSTSANIKVIVEDLVVDNFGSLTALYGNNPVMVAGSRFGNVRVIGNLTDIVSGVTADAIKPYLSGNVYDLGGDRVWKPVTTYVEARWIPAGSMRPRATSGAGLDDYDSGTNDVTIDALYFDSNTQEYAHFSEGMPKGWNRGPVTFAPCWTNTGGSAAQTVVWSLAGRAMGDGDAINGAFGTAQTSTDTWQAQNSQHRGPVSSPITIGNSPVENDLVVFEISRVTGSDDMAGDAILLGIMLFLTMNSDTDE